MSIPIFISDEDKANGAVVALPKNKHFPRRRIHISRGLYNTVPDGEVELVGPHPTKRRYFVYKDLSDREWVMKPWYLNIFHKPWKQSKLIYYDSHSIEGGLGSSEVQLNRKTNEIINEGSYNFRDFAKCGHLRHLWADLLPVVIYFHR